jgi:ABC-type polysaccharide/polyol phosphate transport system ATPase subunit
VIAQIYRQDSGAVEVAGLLSPFIELGVGFNSEPTARDDIRINSALLGLTRREFDQRFGLDRRVL